MLPPYMLCLMQTPRVVAILLRCIRFISLTGDHQNYPKYSHIYSYALYVISNQNYTINRERRTLKLQMSALITCGWIISDNYAPLKIV